jgi:F-type H+-transporting ATPase subunit epsilon
MTGALHLTITTPMDVLVDEPAAIAVRAEDESGGFGILPGHTDFLTALPASVVRWRGADGQQHFCALRAGLMTVADGARVAIACREGILGDDLARLEAEVDRLRAGEADADRRARVEQMRLHASAVRQLMRFLRPDRPGALEHPPSMAAPRSGGPS